MLTNTPKILAIDPGTKELGVAILSALELEHYAVKTFKRRQPPHAFLSELSEFLDKLIAEYRPTTLAIEKTALIQRDSALLNVVSAEVKQTARQFDLVIYEYEPTYVRNKLCHAKRVTKKQMHEAVTSRYPELMQFLRQVSKWEKLYWDHLFDAVAAGLICLEEVYSTKPIDSAMIF